MRKLSEIEILKYWLDGELTVLHIMFAIIMLHLVTAGWQKLALAVYIVICVVYSFVRFLYVSAHDKNYLKIPK